MNMFFVIISITCLSLFSTAIVEIYTIDLATYKLYEFIQFMVLKGWAIQEYGTSIQQESLCVLTPPSSFFFGSTGFELWASCLLGRHSTT
jgi:hypothetical protein